MSSRKSIPSVILTGNNVDYEIAKWLDIDEEESKRYMELLLSKLGYDSESKINVYKYYKDQYDEQYLEFLVNGIARNRICISNEIENGYPIVRMDRDENGWEFSYQVLVDDNDVKLNMYEYSDLIGNRYYTYELSNEWVEYSIEDGEYTLEFRLSKPKNLVSDFGSYKKYEVNNQRELVKYFIGLDFKESIFDIYKKICEIAIGDDVSKYSFIDLRLSRCVYDLDGIVEDKITDLVHLEDGELVSLIVTKDNKQVWYDKNDMSTSYVYDTDTMQVRFSICDRDDVSNVNTKLSYKDDSYIERDNCKNMEDARCEVSKVRKLVNDINSYRNSSK